VKLANFTMSYNLQWIPPVSSYASLLQNKEQREEGRGAKPLALYIHVDCVDSTYNGICAGNCIIVICCN